jgi:hypothetical protein
VRSIRCIRYLVSLKMIWRDGEKAIVYSGVFNLARPRKENQP